MIYCIGSKKKIPLNDYVQRENLRETHFSKAIQDLLVKEKEASLKNSVLILFYISGLMIPETITVPSLLTATVLRPPKR